MSSAPTKVEGSNVLGKLQITWRTNLGEPGRLQTQQIIGNVSEQTFHNINRTAIFRIKVYINFIVTLNKYNTNRENTLCLYVTVS